MWATWRSFESIAARQLKRVYPTAAWSPVGYFDRDEISHDEVNVPLLPTSTSSLYLHPLTLPKPRSHWRTRLRHLTFFSLAFVLLLCIPKILEFLHPYADPGSDDVFSIPPYTPHPKPVEHLVHAVGRTQDGQAPSISILHNELATRLDSLGMPAFHDHIHCTSLDSTASITRYAHLASPSRGRTIIGLNLFNSGGVLPTIGRSLLDLIYFLGPENVLVSIFENGSSDNTTLGLAHLAAVLSAAGVPHSVLSDSNKTHWEGVDRIAQLAIYRNIVLDPLYATWQGQPLAGSITATNSSVNPTINSIHDERPFENVLFINDVFFCPTDALELMHVRAVQQAHATCGLDWRWRHSSFSPLFGSGPKFYDNWVSRTLNGNTFRSRLDIFSEMRNGLRELIYSVDDTTAKQRFADARPVPVYSCWNGMIVMDARPFVAIGPDGEFRKGKAPVRFRPAKRRKGECAASECKLVAKDFWKRGFDRWVLVPYVRTTYVWDLYNQFDLEDLVARARGRWRSPPPSLVGLPSPPRLSLRARSFAPPSSHQSSPSGDPVRSPPEERSWTYPSSPHPPPLEPLDEFSIIPSLNLTAGVDDIRSTAVGDPENDHRTSITGHLRGEELDLLAWDRIQGPQTVVCWPYHRVGNIEWWWTKVIEKVKKPLAHLRR
jgi:hypothetical protein